MAATVLALAALAGLPVPAPTQPPAAFNSFNKILSAVRLTPPDMHVKVLGKTVSIAGIDCQNMSLGDLSLPAAPLSGGGAEAALIMTALRLQCSASVAEGESTAAESLSFSLALNASVRAALVPAVNSSVPSAVALEGCNVTLPAIGVHCTPKLSPLCVLINTALPGLLKTLLNGTVCSLVAKEAAPTGAFGGAAAAADKLLEQWQRPVPPFLTPAQAEGYLAPWLGQLGPWSMHGKLARLARLIDFVPAFILDWIIGAFTHGGVVTVPLNMSVTKALPLSAGNLTVALGDLTVSGLNKFTKLQPLRLDSDFTWSSKIAMKTASVVASANVSLSGGTTVQGLSSKPMRVQVSIPVSGLALDMAVVLAMNASRVCSLGADGLKSSLACMLWPALHQRDAGGAPVSGINVTNLQVTVASLGFSVDGLGSGLDGVVRGALAEVADAYEAALLTALPRGLSRAIQSKVNSMLYTAVGESQADTKCKAATTKPPLAVSRVCIVNNAGFVMSYSIHDCMDGCVSPSTKRYPIDQHKCMDVTSVGNLTADDIVRVTTDAVAGKRVLLEPPMRYAPSSNVASFVCHGTTLDYGCKLESFTPVTPGSLPEVSRICVANDAGFVLHWEATDARTGSATPSSGRYPIDQTRCIDLGTIPGVAGGDNVTATVHAVWGKTKAVSTPVVYRNNSLGATFMCHGTTLDYHCSLLNVAM